MSGCKRFLLVFLLLTVAAGADALSAQRGLGYGGLGLNGVGPRLGENVALALELQSELGLSAEQVQALREVGAGIASDVAPLEDEISELRERIIVGDVLERDGLIELQKLLADHDAAADPYRSRMTEILSAHQHRALQMAMFDSRPFLARRSLSAVGGYAGTGGMGYGPVAYGRGMGLGIRGGGMLMGRGGVGFRANRAGRYYRGGFWYRR